MDALHRTRSVNWSNVISSSLAVLLLAGVMFAQSGGSPKLSDKPGTPFKLATFEAEGKVQIGLVLGGRGVDIARANAYLIQKARVPAIAIPGEMRALIEQYETASKRLYQIANYLKDERGTNGLPFAYDFDKVSAKAPIKYPWNL